MDRLNYKGMVTQTSVEVSEDKRTIGIYHCKTEHISEEGPDLIAEFDILSVWDMIRDAIATADVGPLTEPGLFRRKGEAVAGILFTNKLYSRKD